MTKNELIFKNDSPHVNDTFLKTCIFNPEYAISSCKGGEEEYFKFLDRTLAESSTTEEFVDAYLKCTEYRKLQGYQELLKRERPERVWYFIRDNFGNKCFKTESDIGGVRVGTTNFSVNINNGMGDGETRVAVFESDEDFYSEHLMTFQTSVRGRFYIFDYDCGGSPVKELDGRYGIYSYQGLVAFVRCD